jgi:hypothetical protein
VRRLRQGRTSRASHGAQDALRCDAMHARCCIMACTPGHRLPPRTGGTRTA